MCTVTSEWNALAASIFGLRFKLTSYSLAALLKLNANITELAPFFLRRVFFLLPLFSIFRWRRGLECFSFSELEGFIVCLLF